MAADKIVIYANWFAEAEHGGIWQAKAAGIFEKYRIDAEASKRADRATLIRDMLNLVPMSDNTLNKPLQFLGRDTCPRGDHCAHGFRSTASTLLSEEGVFDSGVMEVQLAHDKEK
jgi:hypothetical protein